MDLLSPEQLMARAAPGTFSLAFLLQQGLDYVQRGEYAEGAALLTVIRAQLPPRQRDLTAVLDAFLQSCREHKRLQQTLQEVNRSYTAAFAEQKARAADIERVLPRFIEGLESSPQDGEETHHEHVADQPLTLPASVASQTEENKRRPTAEFFITCFGQFGVRRSGKPVLLCASRSGQGIFRYLVAQPGHIAASDTLQVLFWPDDEPEVAQRKLHVAVSALRRSLQKSVEGQPTQEYIVYRRGTYSLAASVTLESDVERFLAWYRAGQQTTSERIACYRQACSYYVGPFLVEDRYDDWSFLQREQLGQIYLTMCKTLADYYLQTQHYDEAATWATEILKADPCDEAAYRLLMQIYAAQGQRGEALQHYYHCERLLQEHLGVKPLPETQALYRALLASEGAEP